MKKVLVLYPGFPHYRNGIIDKLLESRNIQFYFAGDKENYIKTIRPYDFKSNKYFFHIESFRFRSLLFHKNLIGFVVRNRFDGAVVHSSPYWITIFIAVLIMKLKGAKVYNWTHGILDSKRNLKNYLYYYFLKIFDGLLLYGSYAKNNLAALGYSKNKMKVIFNSLDYSNQLKYRNSLTEEQLFEIRKALFPVPKNPQLIFIGRLTQQKKLHYLIEAIKKLKHNNVNVNLLFVGDGDEKERLIKLTHEFNLKNQVNFYGASYDEESNYKLLASSECCVSPGEIGLTAIHSLMYGTPVISHGDINTQMPEVEVIIPNYNGDLFEKDDLDDLCEKIINVIKMKEKLGRQLRSNCFEIIDQKFNPAYQINVIENIFT